jgi:uncharacterized integral membrane protein
MASHNTGTRVPPDHHVTVATPGSVDRRSDAAPRSPQSRRLRADAFGWGILVTLAVVVVVALIAQNGDEVIVDLLWWSIRLPLSVVVFGAGAIGVVVGAGALVATRRRRR